VHVDKSRDLSGKDAGYAIILHDGQKEYCLWTQSEMEREEWIDSLRKHAVNSVSALSMSDDVTQFCMMM
jgi:hypothetical protein